MPKTETPDRSPAPDVARLREVLREYWGYDTFRPLQEPAMRAALSARDSLVVLPTGGGKSLCYQAPALCLDGMAVVISPLISLMKDQVDALRACGVSAAFINSTLTSDEKREIANDIRQQSLKLLYVAPERLSLQGLLDLLASVKVSFFAIDEAHCVSMWGHDFRPDYRKLHLLRERFPEAAIHAYTATATERVRQDIARQLGLRHPEVLVGSFDRANLTYRVERRGSPLDQIAAVLDRHEGESGIIYCITRKEVDSLCESLKAAGYSALPYHAGLPDEARKFNQEAFIEDRCNTIVATIAFGMGIDKSDVRYVLHAGLPKSLENYQQESGRAGRDGLEAECCLFYSGSDYKTWQFIIEKSDGSPDFKLAQMESLRRVLDYCEATECRHQVLVRHFGQELDADCGDACDFCLGEFEEVEESLVISQKILSSVYRQEQRFGADYTAQVLKGSREKRILDNGHDRLSTYGLLNDTPKQTLISWIGQLVQQGYLQKDAQYGTLRISEPGRQLLKGEVTPRLLKPIDTPAASGGEPSRTRRHDPHSWDGVDKALFEELRTLRTSKAAERGLPPYLIFGDAALRDMARRRPSTAAGFLKVHGVGQKKCDDFAEPFTSLIVQYCATHDLPTDIAPSPPATLSPSGNTARSEKSGPSGGARKAFELFDAGQPIEEVAAVLGRALSTTKGYLSEYLQARRITDVTQWIDAAVIARINSAIDAVGAERLKPIYEHLGGEIDYDAIHIVATAWRNRQAEPSTCVGESAEPRSETSTVDARECPL